LRCNESVTGVTNGARIGLRGLGGQNTHRLIAACLLEVVWDVGLRDLNDGLRLERLSKALGEGLEM
jgi:hypothetical protein